MDSRVFSIEASPVRRCEPKSLLVHNLKTEIDDKWSAGTLDILIFVGHIKSAHCIYTQRMPGLRWFVWLVKYQDSMSGECSPMLILSCMMWSYY